MRLKFLLLFLLGFYNAFSQQIDNGYAPVISNFSNILTSGVYGGCNPNGKVPDDSHDWQHLLVIRHVNTQNNYQIQLASTYSVNDRIFFRKIAGELAPIHTNWIEFATRGTNTFWGNQIFMGNIGIGTTSAPTERLEVAGYIKVGTVSLGGASFTESPKNYVNLSADGHGTLLLSSNLYLNNSRLYIANTHSSMAGAAIKIPGNGQERQGYVEFWTSPPGSVTSGSEFVQASPRMVINTSGNLGIGTNYPSTKLEIAGSNNGSNNNSWINLDVESTSNPKIYSKGWNANFDFFTYTISGNSNLGQLHLNSSGSVGIGTTSPGNYKLNVAGPIRADEIVVNTTGADFVFEPTYKLRSLSELETFIRTNKHLPDIAPAKEMQENGVSAGEMQTKLLQKVEELTLYVIELKKENEEQKKEILKMKMQVGRLVNGKQ